jgi:hypothetical protein
MTWSIRRLGALAVLFTLMTRSGAADEPLTRVQIARLGKAATALVEGKAARGQGSGSACCIHKDGWFLTNAHVAQGEITLVLNPSLPTQKAYPARVVRSDTDLDLALLQADGARDLPALALGSDEGLEELMEVVAFGYPWVDSPAPGPDGYPAISVNVCSITALRRQEGRLKEIQLDGAALTPHSPGGPVLDSHGKVIGVVRPGPTGMHQAIPVSAVARFLARPEVQFDLPRLGSAELHKPVRFDARVTPLLPSAAPLTVELILKAGKGPERTARMEADGDRYQLTAVPIQGPSGQVTLQLMARFEDGSLEATTTDRTFKAGGRELALADVRTIWPGSSARVALRDGTTITGALSGLDAVPVPVGTQMLSIMLDRAKSVEVKPEGQSERVACTLVVRQGEKEVYRDTQGLGDAGLLTNPSFEAGFKGWTRLTTKGAEAQFDLDTNVVREGRQSVRISVTQLSDSCIYQDLVLKPGHRYRLSGWVRTRGLNPHGANVYGTFQVQPGTSAYSPNRPKPNHGGDNEWTEVTFTFEAPSDGRVRIVPTHVDFGMGTGTVWFDDLKLEEISPAGEPAPTATSATQPNGSVLTSLSRVARPAAGVTAILGLIALLCSCRSPWWGKSGWRWPLWSRTVSIEATGSGCPPTFRPRFLRLRKPRAPDVSFINSDLIGPARDPTDKAPEALGFRGVATGVTAATVHPDVAILALFAAGRLRASEMERLGEHLAECPVCLEVLEQLPEDSMVELLRDHGGRIDRSLVEPDAGQGGDEDPGYFNGAEPDSPEVPGDLGSAGPSWQIEEDDNGREPLGSIDNPRYELKTLIGRGGMGLVYLADDHREGRPVVLKFLREDLLDHPRLVDRFRREATAATLLKHPNIVEAYGTEPFGRWPAVVMEYVRGTDLARLIERTGPVPVRVGCELIRQAALGLQYSFERGMVHRDIKPSNLMVSTDGTVKILDFGLAKMQSELSVDAGLTSTGAFLGSVDYMAPEQLDDPRLADVQADIYSLGCTLYHLLSGGPPFQGTTFEVLEAHRSVEAKPLNAGRSEVSSELAALVGKMMAKKPGRRFQTPVEVARRLMPFAEGPAAELIPARTGKVVIETGVLVTGEIRTE